MSLEAHVATLSEKHASLERLIDEEMKHAWWDETRVRQLKLEKLKVKEELARLTRQ
jgi:hypothetical protein